MIEMNRSFYFFYFKFCICKVDFFLFDFSLVEKKKKKNLKYCGWSFRKFGIRLIYFLFLLICFLLNINILY